MTLLARPALFADLPEAGHVVVEASAGTGKTWTIERLVVDLLLRRRCEIEEILVVTFTVRATHELKIRIRETLQALLEQRDEAPNPNPEHPDPAGYWVLDEDARRHVARALARFDVAPIHTIHAFCQRMLTEHAFECGRPFQQQVVATEVAFGEAFRIALRGQIAADERLRPLLRHWLRTRTVADLEQVLRTHHAREGELRPTLDPSRLEEMLAAASRLHALASQPGIRGVLAAGWADTAIGSRERRRSTEQMMRLARVVAGFRPEAWGDLVADLDEVDMSLLYDPDPERRGLFGPEYFIEQLEDTAKAFALAARDLHRALVPLNAAAIQWFLPAVREVLARIKAERGWLDHDDMLIALRDGLRGEQGDTLVAALRRRFRFALIDEFQDTDIIQWEVFRRIFVDGADDRRLFVIGDPKQAIYSFRGGDVATYLQARQRLTQDGRAPLRLGENFRSTPELIGALNRIFDQNAEAPFFTGQINYEVPVVAGRTEMRASRGPHDVPPIALMRVQPRANESLSAPLIRKRLGVGIAMEIRRLLTDTPVHIHGADGPRAVRAREIFVLTRTNAEANGIAANLRNAGIAYAFFKRDGLFRTPEAADIRDLLLAVAHPRRQSFRMHAWYTPFFRIPLDRLQDCRDLPETHPLVARLYGWHALAHERRYEKLFAAILSESGLIRRELLLRDTERELTNYLHLFEVLLDEANRSRGTLDDLVAELSAFIEGRRKPPGSDADVQRIESEREAVQIMTIHKAKGLEAGVVFVYGGFTQGRDRPPYIYHETDDDGATHRIVGLELPDSGPERDAWIRESREEDQRLLYVALTRARARIYLPYYRMDDLKHRSRGYFVNSSYELLRSRLETVIAEDRADNDAFASRFEVIPLTEDALPRIGASDQPPTLQGWQVDPRVLDPTPRSAPDVSVADRRQVITSYSRMKARQQRYVGANEPVEAVAFNGEAVARVDVRPDPMDLPGGPAAGSFIHGVLENISFAGTLEVPGTDAGLEDWRARADVGAVVEETLLRHGFGPDLRAPAERMVFTTLRTPVRLGSACLPDGLASADRHLAEMEFTFPIPESHHPKIADPNSAEVGIRRVDRGWVKGFIDLLFEANGRVYFLDWKTDVLPDYGLDSLTAHIHQHYGWQARLYTLAVSRLLEAHSAKLYKARFGGLVYCFTRGMRLGEENAGVYFSRPKWKELQGWERELRAQMFL